MTNDELRKLAEAAVGHQHRECLAKTKFRKAATPERILALLDENERMRALYEAVAQWANAMNRDDCRASEINLFNVYDSVKDGDA